MCGRQEHAKKCDATQRKEWLDSFDLLNGHRPPGRNSLFHGLINVIIFSMSLPSAVHGTTLCVRVCVRHVAKGAAEGGSQCGNSEARLVLPGDCGKNRWARGRPAGLWTKAASWCGVVSGKSRGSNMEPL